MANIIRNGWGVPSKRAFREITIDGQTVYAEIVSKPLDEVSVTTLSDGAGAVAKVEPRKQTPTGNALNVQIGPGDVISNIPVVIEVDHHQLHEGETFQYSRYWSVNGTYNIRIKVPDVLATKATPHMLWEVIADGAVFIYLWENVTWTSGGTLETNVYNRNRNVADVCGTKFYVTGGTALTVNAAGTKIYTGWLIQTSKTTLNAERSLAEWDLRANTEYNLQFVTSTATNILLRLHFYEDLGV